MSLLMAAALAVGAGALLLGAHRTPITYADPVPIQPRPDLPSRPERLVRIPSVAPASTSQWTPVVGPEAPLTITVRGADPALPPTAGIAVIDGSTGALLRWLPLGARSGKPGPVVSTTAAPVGTHWICLASDQETARHGYYQRERCALAETGAEVALDGALHQVQVVARVGDAAAARTLFTLARADDAHWRPPEQAQATRLLSDEQGRLRMRLPAGEFRLLPILRDGLRPFAFRAPAEAELRADFVPE